MRDLIYPVRGIHETAPPHAMPEGTAPYIQNCRTMHGDNQLTGGTRDGLILPYDPQGPSFTTLDLNPDPVGTNNQTRPVYSQTNRTFGTQKIHYAMIAAMRSGQRMFITFSGNWIGAATIRANGTFENFRSPFGGSPSDPAVWLDRDDQPAPRIPPYQTTDGCAAVQTLYRNLNVSYPDAIMFCDGVVWRVLLPVVAAEPVAPEFYMINVTNDVTDNPNAFFGGTPLATNIPDLIAVFRARVVVSRANQSVYYMSKQGDGTNFNVGDTTTPPSQRAIAGNNALAGLPGDPTVALIPVGQDYLVFAAANNLWRMEGDPGYGGRMLLWAPGTGMLGKHAWTYTDDGNYVYFLSQNGLHKMDVRSGTAPQPVSGERMYKTLQRFADNTVFPFLAYDRFRQEVHILLRNNNGSVYKYAVYNTLRDTFESLDRFPADAVPSFIVSGGGFGSIDEGRRVYLCNFTGVVNKFDSSAKTDTTARQELSGTVTTITPTNGAGIESLIRMALIASPDGKSEVIVTELGGERGGDGATTTFYLLSAKAIEDIEGIADTLASISGSSLVAATGSILSSAATRVQSFGIRSKAAYHQVVLACTTNSSDNKAMRLSRIYVDDAVRGKVR